MTNLEAQLYMDYRAEELQAAAAAQKNGGDSSTLNMIDAHQRLRRFRRELEIVRELERLRKLVESKDDTVYFESEVRIK